MVKGLVLQQHGTYKQGLTCFMSKCHVGELSEVYEALFKDAAYAFPALSAEFERDLNRLRVLVGSRGLRVYLEYLPAVGKHFDRCLSVGQYDPPGLPLTKRRSGGELAPKFLGRLFLLVFHENGSLREDCNVEAIFFIRQILFAAKKAVHPCSHAKIEDAVVDLYMTDAELPEPEQFWNAESPLELSQPHPYLGFGKSRLMKARVDSLPQETRGDASIFLVNLDKVSRLITTTLGSYDPSEWRFKHGPGAIAERTGPSNKYCWENWSEVLDSEYPIADYGYHSYSSWAGVLGSESNVGSNIPMSRLVAVPKSFSGPRLIACEPSEHQWCQQSLWHYFRVRTERSWLSGFVQFQDQTLNQSLCSKGSVDGSLATVDLSSASDRVTPQFVGEFFRSQDRLLRCLRATRTRFLVQNMTSKVDSVLALRKFSTMGSACTFPVQTLIFLGIAIASVLTKRKNAVTLENVRALMGEVAVFGDDIVIPTDCRELFVSALEMSYFKVNTSKSYWTGKFRESCGVDAFGGVTITPAYWRAAYDCDPESLAMTIEVSNNFYKRFLLNTSKRIASALPNGVPQVTMASGVSGCFTRTEPQNHSLRVRWNEGLQREEIEVLSLIAKQDRSPTNDDSAIFQYFTESPEPTSKWVHGIPQRPKLRKKRRWVSHNDVLAQGTRLRASILA